MTNFWTSGQDMITKRVWLFRSGGLISREDSYKSESLQGLEDVNVHKLFLNSPQNDTTTCISAKILNEEEVNFNPESCLEKKPFICQQFLE